MTEEEEARITALERRQWLDPSHPNHPTKRQWGSYRVLTRGKGWAIKTLCFNPNSSLSLQKHKFREEAWIILSGEGLFWKEGLDQCIPVKQGACFNIPKNHLHWMRNTSQKEDLIVLEAWLGTVLNEEDIERIQDETIIPIK